MFKALFFFLKVKINTKIQSSLFIGLLFYIYKCKPRKEIGMKNKLRKMLSLVLSVVIAMSAISLNTFAATIMNIVAYERTDDVYLSMSQIIATNS